MSYVEVSSLKKNREQKQRIDKLIDNANVKNLVQQEINPRPNFKIKFPKLGNSSYISSSAKENAYQYTEWNSLVKDTCLEGYNKCTFNDEEFRKRLYESKDLNYALQQGIGFELDNPLYGGFATLLAITADHGIKTKFRQKNK